MIQITMKSIFILNYSAYQILASSLEKNPTEQEIMQYQINVYAMPLDHRKKIPEDTMRTCCHGYDASTGDTINFPNNVYLAVHPCHLH